MKQVLTLGNPSRYDVGTETTASTTNAITSKTTKGTIKTTTATTKTTARWIS